MHLPGAVVVLLSLGTGAAALAQAARHFQSPTGNIHCMIATGDWTGARCDPGDAVVTYARPADCDLDWGQAFEVGARGPGYPVCAGDTVASPDSPVLPYGGAVALGGITCRSERTGMTCTNRAGHGFSVARRTQRVF